MDTIRRHRDTVDYEKTKQYLTENALDFIFFATLFLGIVVARVYRSLRDPHRKRVLGTGIGVVICYLICGHHMIHTAFMTCGNIIIIKSCNIRYLHQVSLGYTWTYLLYLQIYVIKNIYMKWMFQTLALRLVGMAFELRIKAQKTGIYERLDRSVKIIDIYEAPDPTGADIISYAYFFVGIQKGPYFRWKLYHDYINLNTPLRIRTAPTTGKIILQTIGFALINQVISSKYSSEAYFQDSFYTQTNSDYRYIYNLPQLVALFCKYQVIMLIATCVCNESGFGWFPNISEPVPGYGPTKHLHSHLNVGVDTKVEHEYTFSMMTCINYTKVIVGPKMKDTMRGWDMPTRYWYWAYAFKSVVGARKEIRTILSFFVYSIWCSASVNQFISGLTLWVYVHLEHDYDELYDTKAPSLQLAWNIGFSIMRLFCLIYLTPCMIINNPYLLFKYYYSIYWGFHVVLLLSMIMSLIIHKFRGPSTQVALSSSRTSLFRL